MRIVLSTDTIQRGGKERQLFIIAKSLIEEKFDLHIVSMSGSDDNYIAEYHISPQIIHIVNDKKKIDRFRAYKKKIIEIKPDLIFCWDVQTSIFSLILQKRLKFRFINGSIQHGIRLFRFSHIIRSITCWLSNYIVANSHAGLKANNLTVGKNIFVLYNGVESKFRNTLIQKEKKDIRNKMIPKYLDNPGRIYISIANLVPYKDYSTVLKALKQIEKKQSFYYFIIGDGPMKNYISELIKESNLSDRVFLIGKIENVRDYLFISDCMIHSSRGEGISNSILEGMYAGLPIVATNVGGIPETVWPNSSKLFDYKHHEQLAEILLNFEAHFNSFNKLDPEYLDHLNKFSLDTMVAGFHSILNKVLFQNA